MKTVRSIFFLITLCLTLISAQAYDLGILSLPDYAPEMLDQSESNLWASMSANEAGAALMRLRHAADHEGFAIRLKLLLDKGRSISDILRIINIIGLPLRTNEVTHLSDLIMDTPIEIRLKNIHDDGYSLEAYYPDRIELVFLNEIERAMHQKAVENAVRTGANIAQGLSADLEGRLSVWSPERKIHLGGSRVDFSTMASFMTHRLGTSLRADTYEESMQIIFPHQYGK